MEGRLAGIPGFGIDRVAEAAGSDPTVLRLENYDTDIPPHPDAVEATRAAIGRDEANSYLPFSGLDEMKEAVAELIARRGGPQYDPYSEIVITDGDGSVSLEEWETARAEARRTVERQRASRPASDALHVLGPPPNGGLFLLATFKSADVARRYRRSAYLAFGGFFAAVFALGWLMQGVLRNA